MAPADGRTAFQRFSWPVRVQTLRLLRRVAPGLEPAAFHLGNAYAEVGRADEAVPHWLAAAQNDRPRWAALQNVAGPLMTAGRGAELVGALERFVAADGPRRAEGYALLGRILQKAGEHERAVAALEASLALHPEQDGLRMMAAVLLERLKQVDRALAHYRQVRSKPLDAQADARIRALTR